MRIVPARCNAKHPSKPSSRNTEFFPPSRLRNLAGAVRVQTRGQVLETAKAAGPGRVTHADQTRSLHGLWLLVTGAQSRARSIKKKRLHANGNKNSVAAAKPGLASSGKASLKKN
jgi:hypothetical protein